MRSHLTALVVVLLAGSATAGRHNHADEEEKSNMASFVFEEEKSNGGGDVHQALERLLSVEYRGQIRDAFPKIGHLYRIADSRLAEFRTQVLDEKTRLDAVQNRPSIEAFSRASYTDMANFNATKFNKSNARLGGDEYKRFYEDYEGSPAPMEVLANAYGDSLDPKWNEAILLFGTTWDKAVAMVDNGFRSQEVPHYDKHDNPWGPCSPPGCGSYFSDPMEYKKGDFDSFRWSGVDALEESVNSYDKSPTIMVARVALGNIAIAGPSMNTDRCNEFTRGAAMDVDEFIPLHEGDPQQDMWDTVFVDQGSKECTKNGPWVDRMDRMDRVQYVVKRPLLIVPLYLVTPPGTPAEDTPATGLGSMIKNGDAHRKHEHKMRNLHELDA